MHNDQIYLNIKLFIGFAIAFLGLFEYSSSHSKPFAFALTLTIFSFEWLGFCTLRSLLLVTLKIFPIQKSKPNGCFSIIIGSLFFDHELKLNNSLIASNMLFLMKAMRFYIAQQMLNLLYNFLPYRKCISTCGVGFDYYYYCPMKSLQSFKQRSCYSIPK